MTKKYRVRLGEPVNRTIEAPSRMDAHALLWASAKGREFIPAVLLSPNHPIPNDSYRDLPLPDPRKFQSLRERIGYWETVLEIDDPEVVLGAAVVAALNSYFELMMNNRTAADPAKFAATITEAAREWAEECFHVTAEP